MLHHSPHGFMKLAYQALALTVPQHTYSSYIKKIAEESHTSAGGDDSVRDRVTVRHGPGGVIIDIPAEAFFAAKGITLGNNVPSSELKNFVLKPFKEMVKQYAEALRSASPAANVDLMTLFPIIDDDDRRTFDETLSAVSGSHGGPLARFTVQAALRPRNEALEYIGPPVGVHNFANGNVSIHVPPWMYERLRLLHNENKFRFDENTRQWMINVMSHGYSPSQALTALLYIKDPVSRAAIQQGYGPNWPSEPTSASTTSGGSSPSVGAVIGGLAAIGGIGALAYQLLKERKRRRQ